MRRISLSILVLALVAIAFGSEFKGNLRIAGGTAHLKVMKDVAKVLQSENPALKISVAGGGSGVGVKSVGESMVEIGNSGRDLTKAEITKYGLIPHKIAIDGIAVVLHPENRVSNLTFEQLKKIFNGSVSNWQEFGGLNQKINIYTRDAKSGTRKTFAKLGLKKEKISRKSIVVNSNGNMKQAISNDKNGIGYMSVGYLDASVKGVAIEGVLPTLAKVKSGDYKIQRYLYSVTKGEPKGATKLFLDYLLGVKGQKIVTDRHFIPVN